MFAVEKGVSPDSKIFFHTPSLLAKSIFFHLICVGEFNCDGSYHIKRESYNSFLLMFIKKGQGTLDYNGRVFPVQEEDVVLINCYKPHEYFTTTGWEAIWIHFDGNNAREFYETIQAQQGFVIPLEGSRTVPKHLELILEGFHTSRPHPEPMVSAYIHRMLSELLLLKNPNLHSAETGNPMVQQAIDHIERHFRDKLSVESLAAHVRVSPFHFSRQFKKETGYSPYEFIIKTRLDRAKELLKNTPLLVKEIAFDAGFSSEPNFIFAFRNNVGMTPGEFRNTPF